VGDETYSGLLLDAETRQPAGSVELRVLPAQGDAPT
jgi:hypothetical protein